MTGELIEFCDLGEMSYENYALINNCKEENTEENGLRPPPLVTHIMPFMVRGLFTSLHHVFCIFSWKRVQLSPTLPQHLEISRNS